MIIELWLVYKNLHIKLNILKHKLDCLKKQNFEWLQSAGELIWFDSFFKVPRASKYKLQTIK